ncbi:hypothetical protein AGMMS50256_29510 [Betaproteobacteria bacterium]|nr:hypothetical protein AGMMS50256_29510 [Betaproteobacteria bacterium]
MSNPPHPPLPGHPLPQAGEGKQTPLMFLHEFASPPKTIAETPALRLGYGPRRLEEWGFNRSWFYDEEIQAGAMASRHRPRRMFHANNIVTTL